MGSRGSLLVLLLIALLFGGARTAQADAPAVGASLYLVRADQRLCPSPLCGGYWVSLANRGRTRCADGVFRSRCYVARAVDEYRHPLSVAVPTGALARAVVDSWTSEGFGELGVLVVVGVFRPAGRAPESGPFYRVRDTRIRCVRAPCFSFRATLVNRGSRRAVSGMDLGAALATRAELSRAEADLTSANGLLARGRMVTSRAGGRVLRATRLYLTSQA